MIAAALMTPTWRSAVLTSALVGVVAGLTKGNFVVVAVLGSMLLLLRWASLERPTLSWQTARRLLAIGPVVALPVLLSAAGSFGWARLAAMRNTTGAPSDGGMSAMLQSTLGPHERVADELATLLHPSAPAGYSVLSNTVLDVVGQIVVLAVWESCICAWVCASIRRRSRLDRAQVEVRPRDPAFRDSAGIDLLGVQRRGGCQLRSVRATFPRGSKCGSWGVHSAPSRHPDRNFGTSGVDVPLGWPVPAGIPLTNRQTPARPVLEVGRTSIDPFVSRLHRTQGSAFTLSKRGRKVTPARVVWRGIG